jgi:oligopeptide transport system ATP-binding protein
LAARELAGKRSDGPRSSLVSHGADEEGGTFVALLEVKDLHALFDTREGIVNAVDGVSFEIQAGETLGLVGESGCGKSVTALSLMRLLPAPPARISAGVINFDGHDLLNMSDDEVRSIRGNAMAMIFQDPMTSLNPVLPIGQQMTETLRLHLKMTESQARDRAAELLELVGIAGAARRLRDYPHQFSGGMRQRVMIAMAISCHPKLILADEITTALDVTIQAQILDLLKRLTQELNTAFLLITHDLGIVAGMTQRAHVMYAGQIVEKATTTELFDNPRMPYTWGLLRSIPRLSDESTDTLIPIEGQPPDLMATPQGCRFAERCRYRRDICDVRQPDLLPVPGGGPDHEARCWGTQGVPGGGWLIDTDWRREVASPLAPPAAAAQIRARELVGSGQAEAPRRATLPEPSGPS